MFFLLSGVSWCVGRFFCLRIIFFLPSPLALYCWASSHRLGGSCSLLIGAARTYVLANPFDHLRTCFFPLLHHVIIIFSQLDAALELDASAGGVIHFAFCLLVVVAAAFLINRSSFRNFQACLIKCDRSDSSPMASTIG
ncbi:hypothetical protein T06_4754 [Trichinella sp. T6]|nr:hypothetical protein T06_4754 [Trichinella sp. T6]